MAIAFDAVSTDTTGGASFSWSHTCTGSNRALLVGTQGDVTDTQTAATYNGVAMTLLFKYLVTTNRWQYVYYLNAPASGTNTIAITGGSFCQGMGISYNGVSQSGQPEVSTTNNNSGLGSITTSLTTLTNNNWCVLLLSIPGGAMSAGTGSTSRVADTSEPASWYDTNGPQAIGSISMTVNNSGANENFTTMVALAPFVASSTSNLAALGVG